MKRLLILTLIAAFAATRAAAEPDSLKSWTLNDCLDYALEHNIQLRQSRNDYLSGIEDTKEARAALFPSLTASTSQGLTNYPSSNATDRNSYTGTYGLEAGMTLYNGGKLRTAVKRQQVQNRIDELAVDEAANDIRIAIVRAYMQCLYAAEAVTVNRSTADASKAQRDRAEAMWKAGSISRVDFAQLESQYASDEYQVVVAQSSLDSYRLQLKQLLELDISDEITLAEPRSTRRRFSHSCPPRATSMPRHSRRCPKSPAANWLSRRPTSRYARPGRASCRRWPLRPASARDTCRAAASKAVSKSGTASTRMSG